MTSLDKIYSSVIAAQEAGYTEDEVFDHLVSTDDRFRRAREEGGYSNMELFEYLKSQVSEQQPETPATPTAPDETESPTTPPLEVQGDGITTPFRIPENLTNPDLGSLYASSQDYTQFYNEAQKLGYDEFQIANFERETGIGEARFNQWVDSGMPTGQPGSLLNDLNLSVVQGGASLIKIAGDIYGLATGNMGNAATEYAKQTIADIETMKSDEYHAADIERQKKIAEQDGELAKTWATLSATISNPRLLIPALGQQVAMFAATGGSGNLARAAAARGLIYRMGEEAAKRLATKIGVGTAATVGASMNAADYAGESYDDLLTRLVEMPEDEARQIPEIDLLRENGVPLDEAKVAYALNAARKTGVMTGIISGLAQRYIPGAQAVERTMMGQPSALIRNPISRTAAVIAGEVGSEVAEEVGGQFSANLQAQEVDPERSLTSGLGEVAGQTIATVLPFAGLAGLTSAPQIERNEAGDIRVTIPEGATPAELNAMYEAITADETIPENIKTVVQRSIIDEVTGIRNPETFAEIEAERIKMELAPKSTIAAEINPDLPDPSSQGESQESVAPSTSEGPVLPPLEQRQQIVQQLNQIREEQGSIVATDVPVEVPSEIRSVVATNPEILLNPDLTIENASELATPLEITVSENIDPETNELTLRDQSGNEIDPVNINEETTLPPLEGESRQLVSALREGLENLGPGAANTTEFARMRAAVGADILAEGMNKRTWKQRMREIYSTDELSAQELEQVWLDSYDLLSEYRSSMREGVDRNLKQTINRVTGIRESPWVDISNYVQNSVTKFRAYKEFLRGQQKGTRVGRQAERARLREINANLREDYDVLKVALLEEVNKLPQDQRGRFTRRIVNSLKFPDILASEPSAGQMFANVDKVVQQIREAGEKIAREKAVKSLDKTMDRYAPKQKEHVNREIKKEKEKVEKTNEIKPNLIPKNTVSAAYKEQIEAVYRAFKEALPNLNQAQIEVWQQKIEELAKRGYSEAFDREQNIRDFVDGVYTELENQDTTNNTDGESKLGAWLGNVLDTSDWSFRYFDGQRDNGVLTKNFVDRYNIVYSLYLNAKRDHSDRVHKWLEQFNLNEKDFEKIRIHAEIMQEGGEDILRSMGFSDQEIEANRNLTGDLKTVYDYMRNEFDLLFPYIKSIHDQMSDEPLQYTKNYWPRIRNWEDANKLSIEEGRFDESKHRRTEYTPAFTKNRVHKSRNNLRLDALADLDNFIDNAWYYHHTASSIREMSQVVIEKNEDGQFRLEQSIGNRGLHYIADYVDMVARKNTVSGHQNAAVNAVTRNFTAFTLIYRPMTILSQLTGFLYGTYDVGVRSILKGMDYIVSVPESREYVLKHFPEIRESVQALTDFLMLERQIEREQRESGVSPRLRELQKRKREFTKKGFDVIGTFDQYSRMIMAIAKMDQLTGGNLDLNVAPTPEQVNQVQTLVRMEMGSSQIKDLPQSFSRGKGFGNSTTFARTVMAFQNFPITRWNKFKYDVIGKGFGENFSRNRAIATVFLEAAIILFVEAQLRIGIRMLEQALIAGVFGKGEDDDKEYTDMLMDTVLGEVTGRIPVVGRSTENVIKKWSGQPTYPGASGISTVDWGVDILAAIGTAPTVLNITDQSESAWKKRNQAVRTIYPLVPIPGAAYPMEVSSKFIQRAVAEQEKPKSSKKYN